MLKSSMHKPPDFIQKSPSAKKMLCGGFYHAKVGQDFPPHSHPCWELVCYLSGRIDAPIDGNVYRTEPGLFLLTPPHTVHSERALTGYSNVFISLDITEAAEWPAIGHDDAKRSITETCTLLVDEWRAGGVEQTTMVDILLVRLGILMRRSALVEDGSRSDTLVNLAEQIMEDRYATSLTIEQIAREVGCASSTLRDRFLRHRSHPPHEHLVEIRIRHAVALLRSSTAPLEAIAMMTGFYSSSHLSRAVRKATGKSPGAHRLPG